MNGEQTAARLPSSEEGQAARGTTLDWREITIHSIYRCITSSPVTSRGIPELLNHSGLMWAGLSSTPVGRVREVKGDVSATGFRTGLPTRGETNRRVGLCLRGQPDGTSRGRRRRRVEVGVKVEQRSRTPVTDSSANTMDKWKSTT